MNNTLARATAFILLYTALTLLLFGDGLFSGKASFFAYGDAIEQSYGWMQKMSQAIHSGYLPLWNSSTHGGQSFAGEIQQGVFYPINILVVSVWGNSSGVPIQVLEFWVAFHFVLSAIGFHWLARTLGSSTAAAVGGALLFTFYGAVAFRAPAQVGIFFGLCWIPFAMCFYWRFLSSGAYWNAAAAGVIVVIQVVAGHIQPAFHTIILLALLALFFWKTEKEKPIPFKKIAVGWIVFISVIFLLLLPQLILSIEYFRDAYRWVTADTTIGPGERVPFGIFMNQHSLGLADLAGLINPWRYGGSDNNFLYLGVLPVLIIGALCVARGKQENVNSLSRLKPWMFFIAVLGLIFAIGSYTFLPALMYPIPLFTSVRELARYAIFFHVAAALAFSLALDQLVRSGKLCGIAQLLPIWFILIFILETIWLVFYKDSPVIKPVAQQLFAVSILLVSLRWAPRFSMPVILVSVCFGAWLTRGYYMPEVSDKRPRADAVFAPNAITDFVVSQPEQWRTIIDDSAGMPKNTANVIQGMQTKLGYSATFYRPYFNYLSQDWANNSRVNDTLNVRWIISKKDLDLPLKMVDAKTSLKLYERPTAFPRAWVRSDEATLLEGRLPQTQINWTSHTDHLIRLNVKLVAADKLILSEVYYPGWHAWVDGRPIAIERANVGGLKPLFRALTIPISGEHVVEMRYLPFKFW